MSGKAGHFAKYTDKGFGEYSERKWSSFECWTHERYLYQKSIAWYADETSIKVDDIEASEVDVDSGGCDRHVGVTVVVVVVVIVMLG